MENERLLLLADFLDGSGKYEGKGVPQAKFEMAIWARAAAERLQSLKYAVEAWAEDEIAELEAEDMVETMRTIKHDKQLYEQLNKIINPGDAFTISIEKAELHGQTEEVQFYEMNNCATTACACGWGTHIPEFRKLGFRLMEGHNHRRPELYYNGFTSMSAAREFFGLNDTQAEFLFMPDYYTDEQQSDPGFVAKRLRQLVEDKGSIPAKYCDLYGIEECETA